MRKTIIIAAALLCLCGCGKTVKSSDNEATRRYFNAWVEVQKQKHPEYLWKQTSLGSWILEEEAGTGSPISEFGDSMYVRMSYNQYLQDGTINTTTYARTAQQLGTYDETYYYGPVITYAKGLYAGLEEALKGMKDGGRRKILIPGWLSTYSRFDDAEGYLGQKSDEIGSTYIYDIRLLEHFEYIDQWSADSVGRYLCAAFPKIYGKNPAKATADSSGAFGFWYIRTKAPSDELELKDTTVYINYIGRLLNGRVFDTSIRDTAIRYGLSRDKTYAPVSVTFAEGNSKVTMGGSDSSVIPGFARTLRKMKAYEQGTGIFIPSIGYGYKGSGKTIPAYAPLRFDVELVDKP
ncbi:MAG: FKBP-type peptidyl-prolyl cis-trans isomerase [Bacteroidales bacterium]|nr:FKBP-type peptidyl-prolyl cis-trans isomerase [Bacteroidales bacterium]